MPCLRSNPDTERPIPQRLCRRLLTNLRRQLAGLRRLLTSLRQLLTGKRLVAVLHLLRQSLITRLLCHSVRSRSLC